MKKDLFLTAVLCLIAASSLAQQKGSMYVGGNLGLGVQGGSTVETATYANTSSTDKERTPVQISFGLSAEYGYFVMDNLLFHVGLGYDLGGTASNEAGSGSSSLAHMCAITPGISYYIPLGNRFYYTPGLSVGLGFGSLNYHAKSGSTSYTHGTDAIAFGIQLEALSFEYRPTDHIGITLSTAQLGYGLMSVFDNSDAVRSTLTVHTAHLNMSAGATVGFRYYLR